MANQTPETLGSCTISCPIEAALLWATLLDAVAQETFLRQQLSQHQPPP